MSCFSTDQKRVLSPYIRNQLPGWLKETDSLFLVFIEAYYAWLETEGNVNYHTARLFDYKDVDCTIPQFFEYFRRQYMVGIPPNMKSDRAKLNKHIREFYQSRGSEESFKFFLRAFLDVDVKITYPKDDILRVSGGYWNRAIVMRVTTPNDVSAFLGKQIVGKSSGASAIVGSTNTFYSGNDNITELHLDSIVGTFAASEIIEVQDSSPIKTRSLVYSVVTGYSIIIGGSGYSKGQVIPLTSNPGIDFVAKISEVDQNGRITAINIENIGTDYNEAPIADLTGSGDGTAIVQFYVGPVYYSVGNYVDSRSWISSYSVIQDGQLYQEYSYIIETSRSFADYKDYVLNLLHPAGMYVTGKVSADFTNENGGNAFDVKMFHSHHPTDENTLDENYPLGDTMLFFNVILDNLSGPIHANSNLIVAVVSSEDDIEGLRSVFLYSFADTNGQRTEIIPIGLYANYSVMQEPTYIFQNQTIYEYIRKYGAVYSEIFITH